MFYVNAAYFFHKTNTGRPVVTCRQYRKTPTGYEKTLEAGLALPKTTFDKLTWDKKVSKAGEIYFTARLAVYGRVNKASGGLWINPFEKDGELQVFNAKKFETAPVGETAPVATDDIPF